MRLKWRSYAKVTTLGSCCSNLPHRGPHDFWRFISTLGPQTFWIFIFRGLGFFMSRVFPFMLKRPFEPHCTHLLANELNHHISSQRSATTILASIYVILQFCKFHSLIEIVYHCIYVPLVIYLIYLCYTIGSKLCIGGGIYTLGSMYDTSRFVYLLWDA
jgi:hypothetical protein